MKTTLLFCILTTSLLAQDYVSYFVGDTANSNANPNYLVCLMGGATEDDNAMRRFLQAANGGDVLILRASGTDGYNNYFYSSLGVTLNSVETIKYNAANASNDPYVLRRIAEAEAIWFAGGDQNNYRLYFDNTPVEALLDAHINVKKGTIGGTSAGMAILGQYYFTAENGSITSATALANPLSSQLTLRESFIRIPELQNTITDTHFDSPDRTGRLVTFMAKMGNQFTIPLANLRAISCEEYSAFIFDSTGIGKCYGAYPTTPSNQDYVHFFNVACLQNGASETYSAPTQITTSPLNWTNSATQGAVAQLKTGAGNGTGDFILATWKPNNSNDPNAFRNGLNVNNGVLQSIVNGFTECNQVNDISENVVKETSVYPNPFSESITLATNQKDFKVEILDYNGRLIIEVNSIKTINTNTLQLGIYFCRVTTPEGTDTIKIIKK